MVLQELCNEDWEQPTFDKQESFWRPLFSTASVADERPTAKTPTFWRPADPVTAAEVEKASKDSVESASGPDGITLRDLRTIPPVVLAVYSNLWMIAEHTPLSL